MHRSILAGLVVLSLLGLVPLVGSVAPARGQVPIATPVAAPADDASSLIVAAFADLPLSPLTVRLLRISLAPGASVPLHTHPGPELGYVESGTLTVETSADAEITRAGGETVPATGGEPLTLNTGDTIIYPAGTGMAFGNATEEPLTILAAVLQPVGEGQPESIVYPGGTPTAGTFTGVNYQVLGDGLIRDLPGGTAVVTLDLLTLEPETSLPAAPGPVLLSHAQGPLTFTVETGAVQVTRESDTGLRPNAFPGQTFTLEPGDAAFFPQGLTETPRPDATEPLTLYRLAITPDETADTPPAEIAIGAGDAATPEAAAEAASPVASDIFPEGATVVTTDVNVRIRTEATLDAEILIALPAGTALTITGPPVEADDFVWYPVTTADGSEVSGFTADDFLALENE